MHSPTGQYRFLFASAPFSGVEVFVRNLRTVVERDHEVDPTWINLELEPPERIARVPPFSSNWTLKGGTVTYMRIRSLMRRAPGFDAALFNHVIPPMFLGGFRRSVPSVVSLDVTPALMAPYARWYFNGRTAQSTLARNVKGLLLHRLYSEAARILPWSNLVFQSLRSDYGVAASKMEVIPPCVDLCRWTLPRRRREGGVRVLFVGADFARKGGDLVLEAAKQDSLAGCAFDLVTRTFKGGAPANVRIHDRLEANSAGLMELFADADIFVLPTRADFSPYAVIEAMAAGLPVITTNVGALGELVRDGESGFVIPSGSAGLLAERIRTLAGDRHLRDRMGARGRQLVEERHDLRKNGAQIIELLKRLARRAGAKRSPS